MAPRTFHLAVFSLFVAVSAHAHDFRPESFTVLFPVDFKSLNGARSQGELNSALGADLVPLSRVLSEQVYLEIMTNIASPDLRRTDDPESATNVLFRVLGSELSLLPFENWFVVGLRLSPCADVLPAPPPLSGPARSSACRPQIRLVAQPFGLMSQPGRDEREHLFPVADDKALHLVFDYVGTLPPAKAAEIDRAEDAVFRQFIESGGAVDIRSVIANQYTPAVNSSLAQTRRDFLARIAPLSASSPAGELRVPYGAPRALPAFREFISKLSEFAVPREITHSFAANGLQAGTAERWVFGSMRGRKEKGAWLARASADLVKYDLRFVAAEATPSGVKVRGVVAMNKTELFAPSLSGIDPNLNTWMNAHPVAQGAIGSTLPLGNFVRFLDGFMMPNPPSAWNREALAAKLGASLRWVNSPAKSNRHTQNCASCHMSNSQREFFGLKNVGETDVTGNRPAVAVNAGPKVGVGLSWNFRMLGYFLTAPSIGDRTTSETRADVEWANAH